MDFWQHHGVLFLIAMLFFPRLTLLLGTGIPFSVWTWLGWLIAPRFVAAYYGTYFYWDTNTLLCVLAWIAAFMMAGGESEGTRRAT
jgi:hypothetical protein